MLAPALSGTGRERPSLETAALGEYSGGITCGTWSSSDPQEKSDSQENRYQIEENRSRSESQAIHSAEFINLGLGIRGYSGRELLGGARRGIVRLCRARGDPTSLHSFVGIKSPNGFKRHTQLLTSKIKVRHGKKERIARWRVFYLTPKPGPRIPHWRYGPEKVGGNCAR